MWGRRGLQVVLLLSALFILFTGINRAFGGIQTLGLQGESVFVEVIDEHAFAIQDSHIRFISGIWLGIGVLFLLAVHDLRRYRGVLHAAFALIFLGGLARLGQLQPEVILGPAVLFPLLTELVGMPVLFGWSRMIARSEAAVD